MPNPPMHKMPFPIVTKEAYKFWASRHVCNRIKAIISFSLNEKDAMANMRRYGFPYHFRKRAWVAWGAWVARPNMDKMAFTPLGVHWWDCIPRHPGPSPTGHWAVWEDNKDWMDDEAWVEWIDGP